MKRAFMTLFAVLAVLQLAAEEPAPSARLTLTLDRALEIALNDNPMIRVADLEIQRQDYVRKETVGNLLPSLSASGSYSYAAIKQTMSRSGLTFGADNTVSLGADLSVPLFVPAVYASIKMNRTQMEEAVESARASRLSLVNEVRKAFYNLLLLRESLDVLHESEPLSQKTVDDTQGKFEAELASEYDLLTAQVQLSSLQPTIIQTEGAIEVADLYLHMLLSLPMDVALELEGSLDGFADAAEANAYYSTDISNNSDLRSLDIQARLLENQLKVVNAQRMPTIAAFGQFSLYGNDMPEINFGDAGWGSMFPDVDLAKYPDLVAGVTNALGPAGMADLAGLMGDLLGGMGSSSATTSHSFWWQHPLTFGVSISIPIFSGTRVNQQARQTRIAIEQLQLQREYQEESLGMQVRSSISNLMTARSKMAASETSVAQAQKAYDITDARYGGGMGTILELNSAQLQLTQARLNYTQAVYDYLAAQADYEQIVGMDYEVAGTEQNQ